MKSAAGSLRIHDVIDGRHRDIKSSCREGQGCKKTRDKVILYRAFDWPMEMMSRVSAPQWPRWNKRARRAFEAENFCCSLLPRLKTTPHSTRGFGSPALPNNLQIVFADSSITVRKRVKNSQICFPSPEMIFSNSKRFNLPSRGVKKPENIRLWNPFF